MKTTLTEQQTAHFTKNGSIEFEIPHPDFHAEGRDSWRKSPALQTFILRKLAPIAFALTGKKQLRLGLDQWISSENRPTQAAPIKELFSIQGFAIGAILAPNPTILNRRMELGIIPLPSKAENVLFFRPELILDWPHVKDDLYLVLFTLPNAVYIHNPKDPLTNQLKSFGYAIGDLLKNEFHPLIVQ